MAQAIGQQDNNIKTMVENEFRAHETRAAVQQFMRNMHTGGPDRYDYGGYGRGGYPGGMQAQEGWNGPGKGGRSRSSGTSDTRSVFCEKHAITWGQPQGMVCGSQ